MNDQHTARPAKGWFGKFYSKEHADLRHMLDEGAVVCHLLDLRPIGGSSANLALAFLTTLHYLGKLSVSFRDMLRQGRAQNWCRLDGSFSKARRPMVEPISVLPNSFAS